MSLEMFFVMVLPLILYVVVELKYGMHAGIVVAVASSIFIGLYGFFVWRDLDPMLLTEIVLLMILGAVSYKFNSSTYFKLQPTIIGVVMALYLGYFQIFDTPVLVRMMPLMAKLNPQAHSMIDNENGLEFLTALSGHSAWLFGLHGAFVGWLAYRFSSLSWVMGRLAIYPLMIGLVAFDGVRFLRP